MARMPEIIVEVVLARSILKWLRLIAALVFVLTSIALAFAAAVALWFAPLFVRGF